MSTEQIQQRRAALIHERLHEALAPESLEVTDESHLHTGHAGAKSGLGHFHVKIVTNGFANLSLVARHRQIYSALGDLMTTDIHALGIDALTPDEVR